MGLFSSSVKHVVGVDVSSATVKLLELSASGRDEFTVEAYAVDPLPQNAVVEKNIADVDAVGEAIGKAVRRARTKNKFSAMAVPGSAVITKEISMPASLSDEDMASQIQLEADQYIPYAMEEVNLDFEVKGVDERDPDQVKVMLAASRADNVDIRVTASDIGGLQCKIVDVEAFALENAFQLIARHLPDGGMGQTIALVDVGASVTTLSVLKDLQIVYAREQVFGGRQLTEEIQRQYNMSFAEAGKAKRLNELPDNYISEILEPFKESMTQQVNRSLQFYYSSSQVGRVDRLVLAGGCASIEGVGDLIADRAGVEVSIANPFAGMEVGSKVNREALQNDAPSLMIACGLATRTLY